jgi:hypothetical protein
MDDLDEELRGYLDGLIAKKIRAGNQPARRDSHGVITEGDGDNGINTGKRRNRGRTEKKIQLICSI